MLIKEITNAIEAVAPLYLQESWDNSGMQVGSADIEVTGVLLCTDVREEILEEAIERGANLIISHHPLLFRGLKKIVGRTYQERIVARAIKNDITIYCAHTNMDSAVGGVNFKMAEKIGLKNVRVLSPQQNTQLKIVVFVPNEAASQVERAMCDQATWRHIRANEKIKAEIFALKSTVGAITDSMLRNYISDQLDGLVVKVNEKRYVDETGAAVAFMPANTFVMFPGTALGKTWFGTTPAESDLMTGNAANVSITETGVAVVTHQKVDPVQVETIVSMICLPSFEMADGVGIIDTTP